MYAGDAIRNGSTRGATPVSSTLSLPNSEGFRCIDHPIPNFGVRESGVLGPIRTRIPLRHRVSWTGRFWAPTGLGSTRVRFRVWRILDRVSFVKVVKRTNPPPPVLKVFGNSPTEDQVPPHVPVLKPSSKSRTSTFKHHTTLSLLPRFLPLIQTTPGRTSLKTRVGPG